MVVRSNISSCPCGFIEISSHVEEVLIITFNFSKSSYIYRYVSIYYYVNNDTVRFSVVSNIYAFERLREIPDVSETYRMIIGLSDLERVLRV